MYVVGHLYKQVQDWNGNVNVIGTKVGNVVGIIVKIGVKHGETWCTFFINT